MSSHKQWAFRWALGVILLLQLFGGLMFHLPGRPQFVWASTADPVSHLNLLTNHSFEEAPSATALPPGWVVFSGKLGEQIFVEGAGDAGGVAYTGRNALLFRDMSDATSVGLRSVPLPASPGEEYTASVYVFCQAGSKAQLYLDYWNKDSKRIQARHVTSTRTNEWEKITVTFKAPPETVSVSIILYSQPANVGVVRFDEASLINTADLVAWMQEAGAGGGRGDREVGGIAAAMEFQVAEDTLDYRPAANSIVTTNPPSFIWVPVAGVSSYILEYSSHPSFPPAATTRIEGIKLSIYTPAATLETDETWYWRVYGVDKNGRLTAPTQVRSFKISSQAVQMPLPDLADVRRQIPRSHPRLFVTEQTLPEWQAARDIDTLRRILWRNINTRAIMATFDPLPPEPPNCRPYGVLDINLWRQANQIAENAINTMELLSFAYLITKEDRYGEAARRWILHIASWDPEGSTSAKINSDVSRPILQKMARAYTWAYDALTPQDREFICRVMQIRGREAYQILRNLPYESKPYASHATGGLPLLGEAAIAFLGEIPEAEEWFDYLVQIFFAVYPPWGGDSGGWSEGHAYWNTTMSRVLWFLDALKVVTGLDLYQKPFFQNTGTFKLLTHPPYSKIGPFGDFADTGPTSSSSSAMSHLAAVYRNEQYQWYADKLGITLDMGVGGYIRASLYGRVTGSPPENAPTAAHFSDIGWVVFHRDYLAPENERLQFMFKSSPYGSFSHSLADQNTFTLEAYGEPLAISSGYRPWYGSEHHMKWTKTTQAHNGILVNGQGQQVQSMAAKGRITGFINGESFAYTAGDAQAAYGSSLLERYLRHVVYIRPDVFVIYDDLKAPKDSTFSWLLHAYHPMKVRHEEDESEGHRGHIRLEATQACLDAYLWASSSLSYNLTNQFAVPLDEPMDKPVQWHLTATTEEAKPEGTFLAVLVPTNKERGEGQDKEEHAGQKLQVQARKVAAGGGEGVYLEIGGTDTGGAAPQSALVLFRRGEASGVLEFGQAQSDAAAAAWRESGEADGNGTYGLFMAEGSFWRSAYGIELSASTAIGAELTFDQEGIRGIIHRPAVPGSEPFAVVLKLPAGKGKAIKDVISSHQLLDRQVERDSLKLLLAPGEHRVTITFDGDN